MAIVLSVQSVSVMFMWFCVFPSLRRLSWITIARLYSDLTLSEWGLELFAYL